MVKTQHISNNDVLEPPRGVPIHVCSALPVTRTTINGDSCVMSFWTPTKQELAQINAGKTIAVVIHGNNHPAIMVGVGA